jgi:hypothetical protein
MYRIYYKSDLSKPEAEAETREGAWRKFYQDANDFADSLREFKSIAVRRGFVSRKVNNKEGN